MSSIVVHQTLHGYNDGHRLLYSSMTLEASDARVMLVMSDLSGPGLKPATEGYLTGYPLEKTGKYVLARTWAAPEMPRPGCVWTHSLIIENADLAKLVSAQCLLGAFHRPDGMSLRTYYGAEISLSPDPKPSSVKNTERLASVLRALYTRPSNQILIEAAHSYEDEQMAIAIWMQQWPRLRRSFGFCTFSGMDRSTKGVALDLQFVAEKERLARTKFNNALFATPGLLSDHLQSLLTDLIDPARSTLREFLKRTGGDVDGGRRAMLYLGQLHSSLMQHHPPDLTSAVSALGALDEDGRKQARSVRALVARQALKSPSQVDDQVFEFLLETVEQTTDPVAGAEMGDKLGVELWRRSPQKFCSALASNGVLKGLTSHALAEMTPEQLVSGLQSNTHLAADIAKRRPDILTSANFWNIPEVDDGLVTYITDEHVGLATHALLKAGRANCSAIIISKAPPSELASALESDNADPNTVRSWLSVLCRDQNRLAAFLASGRVRKLVTIVSIATETLPDDVPNNYGEDPWLTALQSASGSSSSWEKDYLAAYFLTRALGWKSRSQAELLRYSYTRVYTAFLERRFSHDTDRLARSRLEKSSWLDWDSCSRLRGTVANRFIGANLDPACFGRLTHDATLALSLIDEAARSKKGRAYLKHVLNALRDSNEAELQDREEYILKKLN
jgi:hypothetical protein